MSKWDERMLGLALKVASWSKDPSTKVGAVVTDSKNRIESVGFNGPPRNLEDRDDLSREEKLCRTIHAEANALRFARGRAEGSTLYITHPPCSSCSVGIIQDEVKRVVYISPSGGFWD